MLADSIVVIPVASLIACGIAGVTIFANHLSQKRRADAVAEAKRSEALSNLTAEFKQHAQFVELTLRGPDERGGVLGEMRMLRVFNERNANLDMQFVSHLANLNGAVKDLAVKAGVRFDHPGPIIIPPTFGAQE